MWVRFRSGMLLLLLVLLLPVHSWAAYALVQSACSTGVNVFANTTTYAWPYPAGYASGNLLALTVTQETRTVTGIAGATLTYTVASSFNASAGLGEALGYVIGNGSADASATITLSGAYNGVNTTICYMEFSGADSDQSGASVNGGAADVTTTHTTGTVTPPTANNVVIGAAYVSGNEFSGDGAFTALTTGDTFTYVGYFIQSAATAQDYNGTTAGSRYNAMRIGAFAGVASGTSCRGGLMLMGVGGC